MGYMKELYIEMQEDDEGNAIAQALGVTWLDLHGSIYEIEANKNASGRITSYTIEFFKISKALADKIEGLENNKVIVSPDIFDEIIGIEEYDYQWDAINDSDGAYGNFVGEISDLRALNALNAGSDSTNLILKRQVFIGLMGSMETYLSDTFIKLTRSNAAFLQNFVRTYPEFSKRTFTLNELFEKHAVIAETAKTVMLEIIYHNLVTVKQMYIATFGIEFPDLQRPLALVRTRHDLVHRNGKTKEGVVVQLDEIIVNQAIKEIESFIYAIEFELSKSL
ncbi:hypothetical protein C8P68_1142 [Mucilaginibacter yixingensis]|uniref:RiboL-PSP-HEPN domain-containing protein n=1 Tax=Mucilaginibacter yixingensis TaxID=1295612 RepID=A0A2T5J4C9_9SPHI|nr:hypothetical protein [Mucilaginibacter yixingensis]PTQ92127.1 hypothetical protein C8P68_1142 [Mucilaginibacter yixingensis]